jgi:phospholipase C
MLAAACTDDSDGHVATGTPSLSARPEAATKWPIKHVVFIIKENRSFDNLFGRFPGADGSTTGQMWLGDTWRNGGTWQDEVPFTWNGPPYAEKTVTVPLTTPRYAQWRYPQDLPHDYKQFKIDYRNGHMDGFANNPGAAELAYTQVKPEWIPNYWHWAQQNVLADNFFASAVGPSFPNHLMTIAATSGNTTDNPDQPRAALSAWQAKGYAKTWGCDMQQGSIRLRDSEGKVIKRVSPCFDFKTEGDLLNDAGIPWNYYGATSKQVGYIWSAYSAVDRYRNDQAMWDAHVKPVDSVVSDIQSIGLDPVTWITPRFEQSEHPEWNLCYGENWTTRIVNAIMASPDWNSTAVFITWDDWGGFYDHVPPINVDAFGYGFRVPLLVISPYAKQGYIDSHEGEFSSVLRFIEDNWGLDQLTKRDGNADNMSYDFDFLQEPRPPDPLPERKCQGSETAKPPSWDSNAAVWIPPHVVPVASPSP